MKSWLIIGLYALVGSMIGVAVKTVINNHTAAANPPTSNSATGS